MSLTDYEAKSWEETFLSLLIFPVFIAFVAQGLTRPGTLAATEDDRHRIWWRLEHLTVDAELEELYLRQRFRCKNSGVEHHTGWCQEHCERFRSHECSGTQASLQTTS